MLLRNVMTSQTSFVYAQVVNRSKFQLEQGGWWLTYVQQIQKTFHKCEMKTIIIWSIKTISRTAQGSVDHVDPKFAKFFCVLEQRFWKKSSFGTLNSGKCSRTKSYKRDSCPHLVKRLEKTFFQLSKNPQSQIS